MSKQDMLFTASNLEKLADYIEQNVAQDQLNMKWYRSDHLGNEVDFISLDDCGPCGCSLGWSPFHPDMPAHDWMRENGPNWFFYNYSRHYYPTLTTHHLLEPIVFGADLSSWKESVIRRLREVANMLRSMTAA